LYDRTTGIISSHMTASDERHIDINVPATHDLIDGHHAPEKFRVDIHTKELIEHTPTDTGSLRFDEEMMDARLIRHLNIESIALLRDVVLGKIESLKRLQAIDDEIAMLRRRDVMG
jgi:hypothetical protein